MKKIYLISIFLFTFCSSFLSAQDRIIYLKNPSFEREDLSFLLSRDSLGWVDCGFFVEEPPSLQPGFFEVEERPQRGKSYLSLVVRDNNTWDAVGQRLVQPLTAGKCYRFTMYLSKAERYFNVSRTTGNKVNYRNPIRLLLWGGNTFCEAGQLLSKTDLIKNSNWETYSFVFQPHKTIHYLTIQAYYLNPLSPPYNGNILVDNASEIVEVSCNEVKIPVQDEKLVELRPRSLSELEGFIASHGEHIVFAENSNELVPYQETKLFKAEGWSQIYFSVIGKSMLHFPSHQLVIAIKGKSSRRIQRRIEFLQKFLNERGVPADAYHCIQYPSTSEPSNWLVYNKDLALRLESKAISKPAKSTE